MTMETKQLHSLSKVYLEAVYGGAKKEAPKDNRLVVTAADKKANTKAYQNYKAGNKAYKAADHLKDEVQYATEAKKGRRWQDDDCDDKWYEKSDVDGKISKREKKAQEKHYAKEGYQRNPEADPRSARQRRMDDPDTGINSQAFRDFMAAQQRPSKPKKKANTKKESFSNWRQDLKEIPDYEQIPASAKKRNEKISEKNVKNTVKINPEMKESVGSAIDKTLGAAGEVADTAIKLPAKAIGYAKGLKKGMKKAAKKAEDKAAGDASPKHESYEAQKTKEVMGALKKRDLKKDVKKKIAADIVKRKGDTSKSDDRYAYESKLWDEVAENLTELGELGGVKYKVVPLDESDIADILARLEKKRISKGGNPDESPLGKKTGRAMKAKQDEVRKKAGVE